MSIPQNPGYTPWTFGKRKGKILLMKGMQTQRTQFAQRFAKHLRRQRNAQHLTQEELADKASINQSYLGNIEQGVHSPSAFLCWRIARALGIEFDEFWYGF